MLAAQEDIVTDSSAERQGCGSKRPPAAYSQLEDYIAFIYAYICRAPWNFCIVIFLGPAVTVLAERDVGTDGRVLGMFRPAR